MLFANMEEAVAEVDRLTDILTMQQSVDHAVADLCLKKWRRIRTENERLRDIIKMEIESAEVCIEILGEEIEVANWSMLKNRLEQALNRKEAAGGKLAEKS
jgi:hypothetical protein